MVVHVAVRRHLVARQDPDDPFAQPTAAGLNTNAVTATGIATQTNLAVDPGASSSGPTQSAPNLVSSRTPTITTKESTSTQEPSTSPSQSSGSSNAIPLGTVIGACAGAFVGTAILIFFAVFFYKRHARSLKERARSRRVLGTSRNVHGEQGRRRSHLEPWNKLEEGDDKWEGLYQTKEVDNVAPMEKLTMFQKSPSVRTATTEKSDEPPVTFDSHPFTQYRPDVAAELASDDHKDAELPVARQFLGRLDTGPAISWDGETIGDDFLSIRSGQVSGSAPTPQATANQPHRWESAEVIHYENPQPSPLVQSPLTQSKERRKSANNPFFNAGNTSDFSPRSRSNSTRSRSNSIRSTRSHATVKTDISNITLPPKIDKGKQRAIEDPFGDEQVPSFPRSFIPNHSTSASQSSISSNDRALQSLIAALDVTEEEVQERLRVASLQPSVLSGTSAFTGDDEDVTGSFPLPPSIDGSRHKAL